MIRDPDSRVGESGSVVSEHVTRGAVGNDAIACLDHDHSIDEGERLVDPVLDQQERGAEALQHAPENGAHLRSPIRVEVRRRLIEQQQPGPKRQRSRQREALLLAARERVRRPVAPIWEVDRCQRGVDPRPDPFRRDASVLEAERDVVARPAHDDLRLRVLEEEPGPVARIARMPPVDQELALGLDD